MQRLVTNTFNHRPKVSLYIHSSGARTWTAIGLFTHIWNLKWVKRYERVWIPPCGYRNQPYCIPMLLVRCHQNITQEPFFNKADKQIHSQSTDSTCRKKLELLRVPPLVLFWDLSEVTKCPLMCEEAAEDVGGTSGGNPLCGRDERREVWSGPRRRASHSAAAPLLSSCCTRQRKLKCPTSKRGLS